MTDLLYSDVEEQLRSSVRDLLTARAPVSAILRRIESAEPYDPAVWTGLARDLGVAGLAVAETSGGAGASWRETAIVAEELGRSMAGTPFLGSSALATAVLQSAAALEPAVASGVAGELLAQLASGARTATVAASLVGPPHGLGAGVRFSDGRVDGQVRSVIDAAPADVLLVPARDGETLVIVAVEAAAAERAGVVSLDMTRPLSDLTFAGAAGQVLASGDDAAAALASGWRVGSAMLASEQLGLAQQCLDMTVEYLKTRYQFGRQIGSYQALKHRAADLWAGVSQARAVARYAAVCVADGDPDAGVAVSLAQAFCSPLAVKVAEECVQLHGGIGFTWEHPAHLYLKRAKADAALFGSASAHRARLGGLVGLPAS